MKNINISDCKRIPLNMDKMGEVVFYDNKVLRVIKDDYVNQVVEMFECGFIEEIIKKKLFPETRVSDINVQDYKLTIEHEKILHWNYPYEWSFDMLKDAALVVLEVNNIAFKYGYEILDGHAYNVVFNFNKPYYIDMGSFGKVKESSDISKQGYEIFYSQFYIPLYLWSRGYPDIARSIYLNRSSIDNYEFFKIKYKFFESRFFYEVYNIVKKLSITEDASINLKVKNKYLRSIALKIKSSFKADYKYFNNKIDKLESPKKNSTWKHYHTDVTPEKNKRFQRIKDIIIGLNNVNSLLDLASNQGKFAEYIYNNTEIDEVIATDYDKEAVNLMYLRFKSNDTKILPILSDVVRPNARQKDDSKELRVKSDLVVALAITHHLVLTQSIPLDYIFKTFSSYSNKYVIIEFMPLGLYFGNLNDIPELPKNYNYSWFKSGFTKYFKIIHEESIDINRYIFVGEIL